MEWVAISGSWRRCTPDVEADVRRDVADIVASGDGIVSGGALGVDQVATDEALKYDLKAEQIKIFLPSTLDLYAKHFRKRASEGVITEGQAESLIAQLSDLKKRNQGALIEWTKHKTINKAAYYARNTKIIEASNRLIAYHVNKSKGTGDAINKAKERNLPTLEREYTVPD